ncbi:MAG: hypothetical protein GY842_03260 [bacterium]|nr:hypothetical protein [bacterium]
MLNKIWFWLFIIGILFGAGKGIYYATKGQLPPNIAEARAAATTPEPPRPYSPDCNTNGIADLQDIAAGQSADCDRNLIPDECDPDCNANDIADACEIAAGSTPDMDSNGIPDSCVPPLLSAGQVLQAAGDHMVQEAMGGARSAVSLCIVLIGVMTLWLGMMNIAKDAGLVEVLAKLLRPAMRWLFPDVPDGHPAQGTMLMNLSANMLGMGNAATPFGLKAMEDLQLLNRHPGTCTNAMAMFLAINTSSVTLIPITMLGIRIGAGSTNVAGPMAGLLMATTVSTITAILTTKALSKLPRYVLPDLPLPSDSQPDQKGGQ